MLLGMGKCAGTARQSWTRMGVWKRRVYLGPWVCMAIARCMHAGDLRDASHQRRPIAGCAAIQQPAAIEQAIWSGRQRWVAPVAVLSSTYHCWVATSPHMPSVCNSRQVVRRTSTIRGKVHLPVGMTCQAMQFVRQAHAFPTERLEQRHRQRQRRAWGSPILSAQQMAGMPHGLEAYKQWTGQSMTQWLAGRLSDCSWA